MLPVPWILTGVVFGALFLAVARAGGPRRERLTIGIGLVIAALFYVAFALRGGAPGRWLAAELAGTAIFGAAAVAGVRFSAWFLALGWGAHVLWDLLLHRSGAGGAFTPDAYPWMCAGFDLLVAGYVAVVQLRGTRAGRIRPVSPRPGDDRHAWARDPLAHPSSLAVSRASRRREPA